MVAQRLDEDEVSKLDLRGQIGETNFVTESGMYTPTSGGVQARPLI